MGGGYNEPSYAYAHSGGDSAATDTGRIEALLSAILTKLDGRGSTTNITVAGGRGDDLGALVSMTNGLRA
jgi:hypothetical protein